MTDFLFFSIKKLVVAGFRWKIKTTTIYSDTFNVLNKFNMILIRKSLLAYLIFFSKTLSLLYHFTV